MENKRFYWIKLKTDFFNQEAIDFLMSQENGSQYVVLYQMLCLQSANNNGNLSSSIGEMIVPYDVTKIARDCKYFSVDTVTIALELFKRLGLIYENTGRILCISQFEEMVGSEAGNPNAQRQKRFREKQKRALLTVTNSNACSNAENNEEIEYRDKSLEIKDKSTEKEKKKIFVKPTLDEIKAYCLERGNNINAEQFYDYYESKGWLVGKSPMKDWKACIRTWERNGYGDSQTKTDRQKVAHDTGYMKGVQRDANGDIIF